MWLMFLQLFGIMALLAVGGRAFVALVDWLIYEKVEDEDAD